MDTEIHRKQLRKRSRWRFIYHVGSAFSVWSLSCRVRDECLFRVSCFFVRAVEFWVCFCCSLSFFSRYKYSHFLQWPTKRCKHLIIWNCVRLKRRPKMLLLAELFMVLNKCEYFPPIILFEKIYYVFTSISTYFKRYRVACDWWVRLWNGCLCVHSTDWEIRWTWHENMTLYKFFAAKQRTKTHTKFSIFHSINCLSEYMNQIRFRYSSSSRCNARNVRR